MWTIESKLRRINLREQNSGSAHNLIIIENGRSEMFYTHWRANTLDRDLFWGPQYAAAFIRAQQRDVGWLDEVWAEGGAIVDYDAKFLLLYGGEDVSYDVPLRRVYLELLRRVWWDWTVYWANEGIAEMADYVGYSRANVLCKCDDHAAPLAVVPEKSWLDTVGSIRVADGRLFHYPLTSDACLRCGPQIMQDADQVTGVVQLNVADYTSQFPWSGFFIDVALRSVEFWAAKDLPEATERVARCWDGWDVTWYRDCFEFHLERAGGSLVMPMESREMRIEHVRRGLMIRSTRSGPESMMDIVNMEHNRGAAAEINPHALKDAQMDLPDDRRAKIFADAVAAL